MTPKQKAEEIISKMAAASGKPELQAEVLVLYVRAELEYYAGKRDTAEQRPIDLSGREFWEQVHKSINS